MWYDAIHTVYTTNTQLIVNQRILHCPKTPLVVGRVRNNLKTEGKIHHPRSGEMAQVSEQVFSDDNRQEIF